MPSESFDVMRKRVLHQHKHSIIRSAFRGHRDFGRGLVLVKFIATGKLGMVHLSYLTCDALKHRQAGAGWGTSRYRAMIIEKVSRYSPDSQIPVVVTDGVSGRFSLVVRRAT
jgi:hypothetical protein